MTLNNGGILWYLIVGEKFSLDSPLFLLHIFISLSSRCFVFQSGWRDSFVYNHTHNGVTHEITLIMALVMDERLYEKT
jgi:hypothetical protein